MDAILAIGLAILVGITAVNYLILMSIDRGQSSIDSDLVKNNEKYEKLINSTLNLIRENQEHVSREAAHDRQKNGFTFNSDAFVLKPVYGKDWKKEESALNKKGTK